jgi:hypothetical protein
MLVLLLAVGSALPAPRSSEAADPLVVRGVLVFIKSVKRATVDRAQAIGTVNASRDENLKQAEQRRQVTDVYEDKGWLTPDQAQVVREQIDELEEDFEDLARRERQIVRHDTKFTRVLAENLRAEARLSAPQILVKVGVPEAVARVAGAAIQGEKPVSAILAATITKIRGGELVSPTEDPFADLKEQVGALQRSTDALRGISKGKLVAQLLGVQRKLEEISGADLPEEELDALRKVVSEAEATLEEAGKVRSTWLPSWSGPSHERFAKDGKWQAILAEIESTAQSRVQGAVAAGIANQAQAKLREALDEQGIDPASVDIGELGSAIVREMAEARKRGEKPSLEDLVRAAVSEPTAGDGDGGGVPTSPDDEEQPVEEPTEGPTPTEEASPTVAPEPTATPAATATSTPTRTPTPAPTAAPTTTPTPAATSTPAPLANRSASSDFALGAYDAHLSLAINFAAGSVSGTLSGSKSEVLQGQCGQGDQLLETAQLTATSSFSAGLSSAIAATGGPFSAPVSIAGTTTYSLTTPFTLPQCLPLNAKIVPPASSFSASGTVSGVAVADNPTSINVSTTLGSYAQ